MSGVLNPQPEFRDRLDRLTNLCDQILVDLDGLGRGSNRDSVSLRTNVGFAFVALGRKEVAAERLGRVSEELLEFVSRGHPDRLHVLNALVELEKEFGVRTGASAEYDVLMAERLAEFGENDSDVMQLRLKRLSEKFLESPSSGEAFARLIDEIERQLQHGLNGSLESSRLDQLRRVAIELRDLEASRQGTDLGGAPSRRDLVDWIRRRVRGAAEF